MKRLLALLLSLSLLTALPSAALEPGLEDKQFSDTDSHWASDYISLCWTSGLMEGVSDDEFIPNGTLTVAQCVAVAARLHVLLCGDGEITQTTPWYEGYADYLIKLGCTIPEDLSLSCTRQQFFDLLADIVPEGKLTTINNISSVPDTSDKKIMSFYKAGILIGTDEFGTFRGHLSLTRAECAAMLARIVDYTLRVKFTPEKGDDSAAMSTLYLPADRTAVTIGGVEISASLYTAALTHQMEVIAAEYQLRAHPDYKEYYKLWSTGTFPGGFERYLSEIHGINEFMPTDWTARDIETGKSLSRLAVDRTMQWLKLHAAVRTLAEKHSVALSVEDNKAIRTFLEDGNFKGESRILYTTTAIEDTMLYKALAAKLKATEGEISGLLASGEYITAEFIRFEKYTASGERCSDKEIAFIRDGAELFAQELAAKPSHFQLEFMASTLKTPYAAPWPTLYAKSETDYKLWNMLRSMQPIGVSEVKEDDNGIYIYLVSNPLSDDILMEEVCVNVGYDRADKAIDSFVKSPVVNYSDAVKYLSAEEFAAKVI